MTDFEEFSAQRKTIREEVGDLLRKFPFLSNNYNMLVWFYWWYIDGISKIIQPNGMIDLGKFPRLTQVESITRAFRELTNIKRKSPQPIPAVQEARAIQEQNFEEYFSRQKRQKEEW